jgi:hypothetical protein
MIECMTADLMEDRWKTPGKDALELYITHQYAGPLCFHVHLPEELKVKPERKNCVLVVIPGGICRKLQPFMFWLINHLNII